MLTLTGEVFCVQEEQYTAKEFLSFLEKVLIKYPGQRIVMILDNAKIHRAKLIQPSSAILETCFVGVVAVTFVGRGPRPLYSGTLKVG